MKQGLAVVVIGLFIVGCEPTPTKVAPPPDPAKMQQMMQQHAPHAGAPGAGADGKKEEEKKPDAAEGDKPSSDAPK